MKCIVKKSILIAFEILFSLIGYGQIRIAEPVFTEDFGTVPDNWKSLTKEWSDQKNIGSFRRPIVRGKISNHSFATRKGFLGIYSNKTMQDVIGGDGTYALGCDGDYLGNSGTWHAAINHTPSVNGETGLALIVNAKVQKDVLVYENTISDLAPEYVYQFSMWAADVEQGSGTKPNIQTILESGSYVSDENYTGELAASADGIIWGNFQYWGRVSEGNSDLTFKFLCESSSIYAPGNIFTLDDISLAPVEIRADLVNIDFCREPGKIWFDAVIPDMPEDLTPYTRLLRKAKSGGFWEWDNTCGIVDSLSLYVWEKDYINYDYRLAVGLTEVSLKNIPGNSVVLNEYGAFSITENFVTKYTCEAWSNFEIGLDFCSQPDSALFTSVTEAFPVTSEVYFRLMRKLKTEDEWDWAGDVSANHRVAVGAADYVQYDFRVAAEVISSDILTNSVTPKQLMESIDYGCFFVKDVFRNDFCMQLYGVTLDYVTVSDSVVVEPSLVISIEGAPVYLRWLYRPFGIEQWGWLGEAKPVSQNKLDWLTFTTGDFRAVYAMNPDLLNGMPCDPVGTRDYYYVATEEDAIKGIPLAIEIRKSFVGGGVKLEASAEKMPSMVTSAVKGFWLVREKGTDIWEKREGLELQSGIPEYVRQEYMFIASMSQAVMDTLNVNGLSRNNPAYWLSDTVKGETFELGPIARDYCEVPGNVVWKVDFSSTGIPEEMPAIGRWMQKEKNNGSWTWMKELFPSRIEELQVSMIDYLSHDYGFVLAWDRDSLSTWNASGLPAEGGYYVAVTNFIDSAFCLALDTLQLSSQKRDELSLLPVWANRGNAAVYGRWMKENKENGVWEWCSEISAADECLNVSTTDFGTHNYRFYAALAPEILEQETNCLAAQQPYFVSKELKGTTVFQPEIAKPEIGCIAKQDSNRVVIWVNTDERIRTFRYRIGSGEIKEMSAVARNKFDFTISQDTAFYLVDYDQEGLCDHIVRYDTVDLAYLPKLQISHFNDLFGCRNSVVVAEPYVKGGIPSQYSWYRNEEYCDAWENKDSLHILMSGKGAVTLKLTVEGEGVCPEDSTVLLITGEHPEISCDIPLTPKEVCVGEPFVIDYTNIDADQYRVTLKESTVSGFLFYPGSGAIASNENGQLEIKNGQLPLIATDLLAGGEFTFKIQLFKTGEYNRVSYRCEDEFEYRFKVRKNPVSRYPSHLKLCANEQLQISPEVQLNTNSVAYWRWRLWDGGEMTEQPLKLSVSDNTLDTLVSGNMNGKRLQLLASTGCGEVVVQDIRLSVYEPDSNWIDGPRGLVCTGDKVTLKGSVPSISGIEYEWGKSSDREQWQRLTGEKENTIAFYAPETTAWYRRTLGGEEWTCPEMWSEVKVDVFNNALDNVIYIHPEDTLVYSGTEVVIYSDCPEREGVTYRWEKQESGVWTELEGASGRTMTVTPEEIGMYRRVALIGERRVNSNVVIINVYDRERNRILYAGSLVPRKSVVQVIGNYIDIDGVRYRWFRNTGEGWSAVTGAEGWNLHTAVEDRTAFVRYVYLPSQPGDSLRSNEQTVYVYDNATDNRIETSQLYVCKGTEVGIKGSAVAGEGITYRWEFSLDEGQTWIVSDQVGESLTFEAEQSVGIRRRVLFDDQEDHYSNVLFVNVIHNAKDNTIRTNGNIIAGSPAEISGSEVPGASYSWERSPDGEQDWKELEGCQEVDLSLTAEQTTELFYLRRKLHFPQGEGCEDYSNVLKVNVFDAENGNRITGPANYVCQWEAVQLTGSDMSDWSAEYRWYKNDGNGWIQILQAYGKDLTLYEGIGRNTSFRRDVVVGGEIYSGNIIEVRLWDSAMIRNVLEEPGLVCAGSSVRIIGSDATAGDVDLSEYIKSYIWENSLTGAGDTWQRIDTAETKDLLIGQVERESWICRVVTTACGNDFRSEPVHLQVRERLKLTLRNDAKFGEMDVREPIAISVDEDFYDNYEFRINGQLWSSEGQRCLFYGWTPKQDYQVSVLVHAGDCVQADSMHLRTPDADLPNVLTPNEDGFNDRLLKGFELKVYNRWGNLVYSGQDGWDGRYKGHYVSAGTYFCVIRVSFSDGRTKDYKRSVTVKR